MYSGHKESRECLLTLVERKTRLEVILKLPNRTAIAVSQAFDQLERLSLYISISYLLSRPRIELGTHALKGRCSSN